ncbi:MAG: asparagine synthase (glutamine-hydrolyzing) [Chthoniobacterales bacterium]
MCGIAGFVGKGGLSSLHAMLGEIVHRGPDAQGQFQDERVFLGHRRLSIIDLSGGAQPMASADGKLHIVFNGEIYNFAELRRELTTLGFRFATDHSDTEVLLVGYQAWGEQVVHHLNGMWAFVIYDKNKNKLFASRDRFGKKPFYYFNEAGTFGFASELRALTKHPACPGETSELAMQKYFAYGYIPAPHSILSNVWKLPAGHNLTYDLRTQAVEIRAYWELKLEPFEQIPANAEEQWCEEIRRLLEQSVKRRMIADVPLGVFLSGGIDSSAVAYYAAKHCEKLRTFSVGFTEASFDELPYANEVAALVNSDHRTETLDLNRAIDLVPQILDRMDEPLSDSSLIPTWLLSRFTRQHVTVALGGDGGDELFAGYDPFRALQHAENYARAVPRPMHKAIRLLAGMLPVSHKNVSLDFKVKRTLCGLSYPANIRSAVWMGPLEPTELEKFFGRKIDLEEVYSEAIAAWNSCPQGDQVDRTTQFFTRLYMQNDILTKVDRASMLNSLEVRAPFLDADLVDFVRRIPSSFKLRNGTTKYLLKKALEPVLPASILYRRKKGFGMPVGEWLRKGSLQPVAKDSRNPEFTERALKAHRAGRADERLFLWSEFALERWQKSRAT